MNNYFKTNSFVQKKQIYIFNSFLQEEKIGEVLIITIGKINYT